MRALKSITLSPEAVRYLEKRKDIDRGFITSRHIDSLLLKDKAEYEKENKVTPNG